MSDPGLRLARLIVDALPPAGASFRIGGAEAAHTLARRLRRGDAVVLIDGSGREALARILARSAGSVDVAVESVVEASDDPLALPPITLAVSAVRAERLAWIAEKATELGVTRLVVIRSDRTQAFRSREGVASRLERIVREAAKQSERAQWPAIDGPVALHDFVREERAGNRLVLDSRGETFPAVLPEFPTALLVGPEGGWSEADLGGALAAGWIVTSLAAGLLRAETAAVSALALARAALARGGHDSR